MITKGTMEYTYGFQPLWASPAAIPINDCSITPVLIYWFGYFFWNSAIYENPTSPTTKIILLSFCTSSSSVSIKTPRADLAVFSLATSLGNPCVNPGIDVCLSSIAIYFELRNAFPNLKLAFNWAFRNSKYLVLLTLFDNSPRLSSCSATLIFLQKKKLRVPSKFSQ